MKEQLQTEYERTVMHISFLSIIGNTLLSVLKLLAGLLAHSGAMMSDAIHSASDVFSTIVVIIGVKISGKESDKEHPYGHERLECVAAIVLATILAVTGLGIGWAALQKILEADYDNLTVPGVLAPALVYQNIASFTTMDKIAAARASTPGTVRLS